MDVEIKSVDYYRQQIDLAVVGGGSEASDEDVQGEGAEWSEGYTVPYEENDSAFEEE